MLTSGPLREQRAGASVLWQLHTRGERISVRAKPNPKRPPNCRALSKAARCRRPFFTTLSVIHVLGAALIVSFMTTKTAKELLLEQQASKKAE